MLIELLARNSPNASSMTARKNTTVPSWYATVRVPYLLVFRFQALIFLRGAYGSTTRSVLLPSGFTMPPTVLWIFESHLAMAAVLRASPIGSCKERGVEGVGRWPVPATSVPPPPCPSCTRPPSNPAFYPNPTYLYAPPLGLAGGKGGVVWLPFGANHASDQELGFAHPGGRRGCQPLGPGVTLSALSDAGRHGGGGVVLWGRVGGGGIGAAWRLPSPARPPCTPLTRLVAGQQSLLGRDVLS